MTGLLSVVIAERDFIALGHEHINMLGRYLFSVPEAVMRGVLRPLNGGREDS